MNFWGWWSPGSRYEQSYMCRWEQAQKGETPSLDALFQYMFSSSKSKLASSFQLGYQLLDYHQLPVAKQEVKGLKILQLFPQSHFYRWGKNGTIEPNLFGVFHYTCIVYPFGLKIL